MCTLLTGYLNRGNANKKQSHAGSWRQATSPVPGSGLSSKPQNVFAFIFFIKALIPGCVGGNKQKLRRVKQVCISLGYE